MAVSDSKPMGIRHVTVVPVNLQALQGEDDEDEGEARHEPRVPRHR